jgi:hypothetical protein
MKALSPRLTEKAFDRWYYSPAQIRHREKQWRDYMWETLWSKVDAELV